MNRPDITWCERVFAVHEALRAGAMGAPAGCLDIKTNDLRAYVWFYLVSGDIRIDIVEGVTAPWGILFAEGEAQVTLLYDAMLAAAIAESEAEFGE